MLIKRGDTGEHENSDACSVREYDFPTEKFGFATAKINGRYPEQNRAVNLGCEQIMYAISGSGEVHSDKGDFELGIGDSYHIQRGEKYWLEGSKLVLALMNVPKWSKEQSQIVD